MLSDVIHSFIMCVYSHSFYSLWDTGYAKIHIPIISSVSEHQPTTWVSFFFDLHVLVAVFPAGVWFCFAELDDARVFVILYAIFASYFAGVMVRLILTLAPIVCVLSAIAFSRIFDLYLDESMLADGEGGMGSEEGSVKAESGSGSGSKKSGKRSGKEQKLYDKPSKSSDKKVNVCSINS